MLFIHVGFDEKSTPAGFCTILLPSWWSLSASEMTYIVSGGALNSTHSLTGGVLLFWATVHSVSHFCSAVHVGFRNRFS